MEKECSRCHKKFAASVEIQEVCPACLADEFSAVSAAAPVDAGTKRNKDFPKKSPAWRKGGAAARMSSGRLRCVLALILLILSVVFIALCNEMRPAYIPEFNLTQQLIISGCVSFISVLLLSSAFRHNKKFVLVSVPIVLVMGGGAPYLFYQEPQQIMEKESAATEKQYDKVLTADEERLAKFYTKIEQDKAGEHFCVLVLFENAASQEIAQQAHRCVAAALMRYLNADGERTASVHSEAYTARIYADMPARLYFAYNARKDVVEASGGIKKILSSFGRITHNHNDTGVFEVVVDAEALKGAEALRAAAAQPGTPDYFRANMELLNCADAETVKDTAERLMATYPQLVSRADEIRNRLEKMLKHYWDESPDAHKALVEAWLAYCDDKAAPGVKNVVLNLWLRDKKLWDEVAASLGSVFESELHNFLNNLSNKSADNELLLGVLDYLKQHGTAISLVLLESYTEVEDEEVRKRAQNAKASILMRSPSM